MNDPDLKLRAIGLLTGHAPARKVAETLNLPIQTIYYWRRKHRAMGRVNVEKGLAALNKLIESPELATPDNLSKIYTKLSKAYMAATA